MKSRFLVAVGSIFLVCSVTANAGYKPIESVETARSQLEQKPMTTMYRLEQSSLKIRKKVVSDLLQIYSDKDGVGVFQKRAGEVLREIARDAPDAVVPSVIKELKQARRDNNGNLTVRLTALLGQFRQAAEPAIPQLIKMLKGEDHEAQMTALMALQYIGPAAEKAVPQLIKLCTHQHSGIRGAALQTLKQIAPHKRLAGSVKSVLESDYTKQKSGSAAAQPSLIALLKDKQTPYRLKILSAGALASIDKPAPEAVGPLMSMVEKADSQQISIIEEAIKEVKKVNTPPQVQDVNVTCTEGDSIVIELPIIDRDDIESAIKARVLNDPAKGNLTREGAKTFKYESEYGHPGRYTLKWKATDGQKESSTAEIVIQVQADEKAPRLVSAYVLNDQSSVKAMFDEPVLRESAENPDNYSIEGTNVKKAKLGERGRTITLTTSGLEEGEADELVVNGVADRSKAQNRTDDETFGFVGKLFHNFEAFEHETTLDGIKAWTAGEDCRTCHVDAEKFGGEKQGNVLYMDADSGDDWQDVLIRTFDPPLQGRYQFEYKFWEPRANHDGNLWLRTAEGRPLIGAGTENPQWEIVIGGKGEVVNDGKLGNDYKHWIHVTVRVDTEENRAQVTFDDTADDDKKTYGWFDLPETKGIGSMGIGPDNKWYVDDVRIRRWVDE